MYRKLDKNNTKNDRTLTLLIYYKIVHHFTLLVGNFCLQPGTKMLRHSTGKPDFFLTKHHSYSHFCEAKQTPLPPTSPY